MRAVEQLAPSVGVGQARQVPGVPKLFDLVSADWQVVGDAKFLAMVRRKDKPPARFATIAEHVWLLEKTGAAATFLVFGNDRQVPEVWLDHFGRRGGFLFPG